MSVSDMSNHRRQTAGRWRTILKWAVADILHERRLSILMVFLVVCLIAPAMVGVATQKAVIQGWTTMLDKDVRNREIIIIGEYDVTNDLLGTIATWPEVGFFVPEPSAFVASARFKMPEGRAQRFDVRTSAKGDPILGDITPPGPDGVVLTAEAAAALGATAGDRILLQLRREPKAAPVEFADIELDVLGIIPETRWPGRMAFLSPGRAEGLNRWIASPGEDGEPGIDYDRADWRSLRIYANDVATAPVLRNRLEQSGFETRLNTDQVVRLVTLSRGLKALSTNLLALGMIGFAVAILLLQRLAVQRKAEALALMSVAGLSRREMTLFLMIQAGFMTFSGVVLALFLLVPLKSLINRLAEALVPGVPPAGVDPILWVVGAIGTIGLTLVLTWYAARDIARLDFPKLLRND